MIYEYRIYDIIPGRLPNINNRFANITTKIWKKHGINVVAFWEPIIGVSNQLHYILSFESLADREKKWNAFQSDEEWLKARAETEKDGPIVAKVTNYILRPTPYSPMQ